MKFAILALIGVAAAQEEGTARKCEMHEDCDKNFDAIFAEWENSETQDPAQEPKQGDLKCAKSVTLKGKDPETEELGEIAMNLCVPTAACAGFEGGDPEAEGYIKIEAGSCEDAAAKLVAGFAAVAVIAATL